MLTSISRSKSRTISLCDILAWIIVVETSACLSSTQAVLQAAPSRERVSLLSLVPSANSRPRSSTMRLRSISNAFVSLATAGSLAELVNANPTPHQHGHQHVDKRVVKVVDVAGPTVVAYEFNGKLIDQSEVCEGIEDGTLKWADGTDTPAGCSSSAEPVVHPTPVPSTSTVPTTSVTAAVEPSIAPTTTALPVTLEDFAKEAIKVSATLTPQASSTLASTSSEAASSPIKASSHAPSNTSGPQGLDREFPDGEIDCTIFPSDYGPIDVEWAGLGGWSGIQYVTIEGDSVTHIDTAVPGGEGCKPGAMCSYACPAGYQKSQWPSQQGSTGQSVGGLSCNSNGKLSLTNPDLSKTLCIRGTGAVIVQNKLSNNAAICRTDYPGPWIILTCSLLY